MAVLPPEIHTYHCICTSLLLASTHSITTLPRRAPPSRDSAYILPVPSQAPSFSPSSPSRTPSPTPTPATQSEPQDVTMRDDAESAKSMPAQGYTLLLGLTSDPKPLTIRREDGFEKRSLWRCGRCAVVVGYEILSAEGRALKVEAGEGWEGKVVYLLPGGILGTDAMVRGTKIGEGEVEVDGKGIGIWE